MADIFQSSQPIYQQLAERLKRQIIRGELSPGDKLPSVRETGIDVSVNPNTVQRTYRELESMQIVETRRGQGTFVTEDELILDSIREEMKAKVITDFVRGMQEMGYSDEEIQSGLTNYLKEKGEENI
ncbi:GntR family transcriptional regulator [Oceanobacillus arenosus]|uniref:GntR family transcriptional regulator n=1 Tax=Oceanobacillus arenosus TaxID=1229153 RepID=A0A3D8PVS4_9BACI|nr:GntR family transcriptional regulator [Oceanobacillus arenosus]RDW20134.1 GntR family transcriptional regulator [Oceanobacillus arenosus]